jgi:hypothetical protein
VYFSKTLSIGVDGAMVISSLSFACHANLSFAHATLLQSQALKKSDLSWTK